MTDYLLQRMKVGTSLQVAKDCFCEGYLHEKINYPRPNLIERKLQKGAPVAFIQYWSNLYGSYVRVKDENNIEYDLKAENII